MPQNDPWRQLFLDLMTRAEITSPRGEKTRELLGYQMRLRDPFWQRWNDHPARKLNVGYTCFEFLWYLRADPQDLSITERAQIWKHLAQRGVIQSNYGVQIFKQGQFWRCVEELKADRDSRRATIVILQPHNFEVLSSDIPCTLALTFQIRNDHLHLHVHMRSSDAVFGMGNDVPCFTWTQQLMWAHLVPVYPSLDLGRYFHTSDSMHVYQRHWDMASELATKPKTAVTMIDEPAMSDEEGRLIVKNSRQWWDDPGSIPDDYQWSRWMVNKAKEE